MLEHGAYRTLLDRYYSTEEGIPAAQAYRLARARSEEERQAVDAVLEEFFELIDGVWINGRAEEEIAKAAVRINAAKENGKKGGRPKKAAPITDAETQQKPSGFSLGSENETQQKAHQAPSTIHHTPEVLKRASTHSTSVSHEGAGQLAPDPTHTREGAVCRRLRDGGMADAAVSYLDADTWSRILSLRTDDEIVELALAKMRSRPGQRTGLKYLTPVLLDPPQRFSGPPSGARASPTLVDRNRQAADEAKKMIFGEG